MSAINRNQNSSERSNINEEENFNVTDEQVPQEDEGQALSPKPSNGSSTEKNQASKKGGRKRQNLKNDGQNGFRKSTRKIIPRVQINQQEFTPKRNNDFCQACNGQGTLACCDKCPRSFHFSCLNPPFDERWNPLPTGNWYCNTCKAPPKSTTAKEMGIFGNLSEVIDRRNPSSFQLPKDIRSFYEGSGTNSYGEYVDLNALKNPKQRTTKLEARPYVARPTYLHNKKGDLITCFSCKKSAMQGNMIQCDYCVLYWHVDCINPPMTAMPAIGLKWRCPAHVEHVLPPLRKPKVQNALTEKEKPKKTDLHKCESSSKDGEASIKQIPSTLPNTKDSVANLSELLKDPFERNQYLLKLTSEPINELSVFNSLAIKVEETKKLAQYKRMHAEMENTLLHKLRDPAYNVLNQLNVHQAFGSISNKGKESLSREMLTNPNSNNSNTSTASTNSGKSDVEEAAEVLMRFSQPDFEFSSGSKLHHSPNPDLTTQRVPSPSTPQAYNHLERLVETALGPFGQGTGSGSFVPGPKLAYGSYTPHPSPKLPSNRRSEISKASQLTPAELNQLNLALTRPKITVPRPVYRRLLAVHDLMKEVDPEALQEFLLEQAKKKRRI